jgi:cell division protein FtsB
MDMIKDWGEKAKTEMQKKSLKIFETALINCFVYNWELEANIKTAIIEMHDEQRKNRLLQIENSELKTQNKAMKNEVEFYIENYIPKK